MSYDGRFTALSTLDVVRSRATPGIFLVDEDLHVRFAFGEPAALERDPHRLPPHVETIARHLIDSKGSREVGDTGIIDETIVRVLPRIGSESTLHCLVVERLRTRSSLGDAVRRFGITARESEVLRLLLEGAGTAEIAGRLSIAETTVSDHVKRLARKTGGHSRQQIVARVLGFV
jgi:DNA-binding CsgD family transcriptional regulator